MTLVKFNKQRAFDPWVDSIFHSLFQESPAFRYTTPSVNIAESDDRFVVELAAPGLKKEAFKINLEKSVLTISVEKKEQSENESDEKKENKRYSKREFAYYAFTRSFTLPEEADENQISAAYTDGILKIDILKKEEVKDSLKMIEVK